MEEKQPISKMKPSTDAAFRQAWYKRWWFRALIGLICLALFVIVGLPLAAKYGLKHWLEKNGADQAVIDSIRYNPFQSRISLKGLAVNLGGQTLLSDGVFTIDFGLKRLFKRDIHVEEAYYHDLLLDIEQKSDGTWRFGTYNHTPSGAPARPKPEGPPTEWSFSARNVRLADCKIHFKTPELDLTLVVDEARLADFSTNALAAPATVFLRGTLNGEPVEIDLNALKIVPSLDVQGQVKVEKFDVAIVKKYLEKALPDFAGAVSLAGKGAFSLNKGAMRAAYDGAITIVRPVVGNKTFNTRAAALDWNGAVEYHAKPGDSGVAARGTLAADDLAVAVPGADFALKHHKITIGGDCQVPLAPTLLVRHDGTLSSAGAVVDVHGMKIWQERLAWRGKTTWAMPNGVSVTDFSGAAQSGGVRYENGPMKAGLNDMSVAEVSGHIGSHITVKSLTAAGLSLAMTGQAPLELSADDFSVGAATSDDFINWQTKKIALGKARAALSGAMPLDISLAALDIDEVASEKAATWKTGLIALRDLQAVSRVNQARVASLASGTIKAITATKAAEISVGSVALDDMVFLGDGKNQRSGGSLAKKKNNGGIAAIADFDLKRFAFSPTKGVSLEELRISGLNATLNKEKNGVFTVMSRLNDLQAPKAREKSGAKAARAPETAASNEKGKKAGKSLPIRVGQVSLDGHVAYSDASLPLEFTGVADISRFVVKNIDSAANSKSAVELVAQVAGRAPLTVNGEMALFGAKPDILLDIHLKNYPLSNLSPFTAKAVGTALASGELKIDSTVALKDDYLKVGNTVLLQKLETKTLSPELAAALNNQLPMPLDAALALLRDSKRNITLNVPIEGQLSSLHVGLSSIIITALSKAIVPAMSGYLVYALGPYGALAYVGAKVGQKMMQVSLPPVEFAPGKTDLTLAKEDYLQRIGQILAERPETDLQLVPKVLSGELNPPTKNPEANKEKAPPPSPELAQKLENLGQERAKALRKHLRDKFGVDENRLMISETLIVEDGKPEVLLGL
ncbi:MAG: DUF748 domain-containing protein [Desulfobulbaceae bacterium]|jgi:hypothetical protein|nr:DUF748 domain-containing protein [Desulfobulbaceae bacterium]